MCLEKILLLGNWVKLSERAAQHHARKIPVLLTVGIFDSLFMHASDLEYLKRAKSSYGGALIVAVESDEYVVSKGFKRPSMSQDKRAKIIAGLDCVDTVTILGDARETLLRHVHPTIMIYRETTAPIHRDEFRSDRKILNEQGGKYVILPAKNADHTSDIIQPVEA